MALFYYPSFDVAFISDAGERVPVALEDLDFYNVTQTAAIDTLTTDEEGTIPSGSFDDGSFTVALNDIIEVSHSTFPGTARFTLQASAEAAANHIDNHVSTLVLDDEFTPEAPESALLMAVNDDETGSKPFSFGTLNIGVNYIPYQSSVEQNLSLYVQGAKADYQLNAAALERLPSSSITIPPLGFSDQLQEVQEVYTSDDTLGNTGADFALESSTKYAIDAWLVWDGDALGGLNLDFGAGTATLSLFDIVYQNTDASGAITDFLASGSAGTDFTVTQVGSYVSIKGRLTCSSAGTLILRGSQASTNSNPTSLNGWVRVTKVL